MVWTRTDHLHCHHGEARSLSTGPSPSHSVPPRTSPCQLASRSSSQESPTDLTGSSYSWRDLSFIFRTTISYREIKHYCSQLQLILCVCGRYCVTVLLCTLLLCYCVECVRDVHETKILSITTETSPYFLEMNRDFLVTGGARGIGKEICK